MTNGLKSFILLLLALETRCGRGRGQCIQVGVHLMYIIKDTNGGFYIHDLHENICH